MDHIPDFFKPNQSIIDPKWPDFSINLQPFLQKSSEPYYGRPDRIRDIPSTMRGVGTPLTP